MIAAGSGEPLLGFLPAQTRLPPGLLFSQIWRERARVDSPALDDMPQHDQLYSLVDETAGAHRCPGEFLLPA